MQQQELFQTDEEVTATPTVAPTPATIAPGPVVLAEPWQMLESEYIDFRATHWVTYLETHRPSSPRRDSTIAEINARDEWFVKRMRKDYHKVIRSAIREKLSIPQHVLAQTSLRKLRDDYAAYLKGRHTSFANVSDAIDRSLVPVIGCKVKRQDGKPISDAQKEEIVAAVQEVEAVIGPLADILRHIDLTISHTSGKHPFLNNAGGQYLSSERTVSVGCSDKKGVPVKAFAHEIAHALDGAAGKLAGMVRTQGKHDGFLSDEDSERILLCEIRARMNAKYHVLEYLAKRQPKDAKNDDERVEIERRRLHLGPYWQRPCEVFARLFEQYIATESNGAAAVSVEKEYANMAGWWSSTAFATIRDHVTGMIARRLELLRKGNEPK